MDFFLFGLVENLHSDSHRKKKWKECAGTTQKTCYFNSTSSVEGKIRAFVLQTAAFAFRGARHYCSVRTKDGLFIVLDVTSSHSQLSGLGSKFS